MYLLPVLWKGYYVNMLGRTSTNSLARATYSTGNHTYAGSATTSTPTRWMTDMDADIPRLLKSLGASRAMADVSLDMAWLWDQLIDDKERARRYREEPQNVLDSTLNGQHSQISHDDYRYLVEVRIPRLIYNPFLTFLYIAYESSVREIAHHIQDIQGLGESLDCNRDFLPCAKRYYKTRLHFELCKNNQAWERLKILAGVRNAVVHANGHMERIRTKLRDKLGRWIGQSIGIREINGEVLVSEEFVEETFQIVKVELQDLVKRFHEWHSQTS